MKDGGNTSAGQGGLVGEALFQGWSVSTSMAQGWSASSGWRIRCPTASGRFLSAGSLAIVLFFLVQSFLSGCTRPAPTLLRCYGGDCGAPDRYDGGPSDASPPDGAVPFDAETPACTTSFGFCAVSYPDGPLTVPDSVDVQEGDVAPGAGLLFMAYARFGEELANIGLIGVSPDGRILVERREFDGWNQARVAWNKNLGMGLLVVDSWAHWFDAQGREIGRPLSLSPDGTTQMNAGVGPTEDGFVILAGPMSYDPTQPIPPLWGTVFSGRVEQFDWTELLPSSDGWMTPTAALDEGGWAQVVGATDATGGIGGLWRLVDGGLQYLMGLPSGLPAWEYGPEMGLAYYRGHTVILWGRDDMDLYLGRDDGLVADLGMNGSFGSLVILDDGLVLVSQDPTGAIFIHKLSDSPFGAIEETRQIVPSPTPTSWFLRAKRTPHGIGMVWGGGFSALEMLELDCCIRE